jgi:hypothetical protein
MWYFTQAARRWAAQVMAAQRENPNWPEEWDLEEGTLFAAAAEDRLFSLPESKAELPPELGLFPGNHAQQCGYWAEAAADARLAQFNGTYEKSTRDDGKYDRLYSIHDGRPKLVQVKFAGTKDGKAEFDLGERVGYQDSKVDKRKRLSLRPRAEIFVLVTYVQATARFYVIPSRRLVGRKSLTVTPGMRRTRRYARNNIEPEDYVDAWHHCGENMHRGELFDIHNRPIGQLEMDSAVL